MQTNYAPSFSHYLPIEEDAVRWGMHIIDSGSTAVPPNSPYPPGRHPDGYDLSWEKGRTLSEYQLVYITLGRGIFETKKTGGIQISSGQVFLLFPGVWHRYRPLKTIGWDESWIGFKGDVAKRIMSAFFSPDKAVLSIGHDQELQDLIRSITELPKEAPAGFQQIMAARTIEALALVRSLAMSYHVADREASRKIQQARYHLLHHSDEEIDMNELARELGLSYSRFRSLFREHTGTAPHQYVISIRMNKARQLLRHTELSVADIAERVGFSSPYYFCRQFKIKNGCTPKTYRMEA